MAGVSEDYISLREIESYFNIAGITNIESRLDYLKFLTVIDQSYLKYKSDNPPKDTKKGK